MDSCSKLGCDAPAQDIYLLCQQHLQEWNCEPSLKNLSEELLLVSRHKVSEQLSKLLSETGRRIFELWCQEQRQEQPRQPESEDSHGSEISGGSPPVEN